MPAPGEGGLVMTSVEWVSAGPSDEAVELCEVRGAGERQHERGAGRGGSLPRISEQKHHFYFVSLSLSPSLSLHWPHSSRPQGDRSPALTRAVRRGGPPPARAP